MQARARVPPPRKMSKGTERGGGASLPLLVLGDPRTHGKTKTPTESVETMSSQGENKNSSPQGDNKNTSLQGDNRNTSPQRDNKNTPLQGDNRNTPPQRDNKNTSPQGGNKNTPPQGENKNKSPQGKNKTKTLETTVEVESPLKKSSLGEGSPQKHGGSLQQNIPADDEVTMSPKPQDTEESLVVDLEKEGENLSSPSNEKEVSSDTQTVEEDTKASQPTEQQRPGGELLDEPESKLDVLPSSKSSMEYYSLLKGKGEEVIALTKQIGVLQQMVEDKMKAPYQSLQQEVVDGLQKDLDTANDAILNAEDIISQKDALVETLEGENVTLKNQNKHLQEALENAIQGDKTLKQKDLEKQKVFRLALNKAKASKQGGTPVRNKNSRNESTKPLLQDKESGKEDTKPLNDRNKEEEQNRDKGPHGWSQTQTNLQPAWGSKTLASQKQNNTSWGNSFSSSGAWDGKNKETGWSSQEQDNTRHKNSWSTTTSEYDPLNIKNAYLISTEEEQYLIEERNWSKQMVNALNYNRCNTRFVRFQLHKQNVFSFLDYMVGTHKRRWLTKEQGTIENEYALLVSDPERKINTHTEINPFRKPHVGDQDRKFGYAFADTNKNDRYEMARVCNDTWTPVLFYIEERLRIYRAYADSLKRTPTKEFERIKNSYCEEFGPLRGGSTTAKKRDRSPNSNTRTRSPSNKAALDEKSRKGQPSLKKQRETSAKAWIANEEKRNAALPKEYQTRRAKDPNFQKELNDLEKKLENPNKIYHEARMLSDEINNGTVSRKKYPFLKLADRHTADAAMLDINKLQREMDTYALVDHLTKQYGLRAEELAKVSAETNDQAGDGNTRVPIPGSRSPSSTRD